MYIFLTCTVSFDAHCMYIRTKLLVISFVILFFFNIFCDRQDCPCVVSKTVDRYIVCPSKLSVCVIWMSIYILTVYLKLFHFMLHFFQFALLVCNIFKENLKCVCIFYGISLMGVQYHNWLNKLARSLVCCKAYRTCNITNVLLWYRYAQKFFVVMKGK